MKKNINCFITIITAIMFLILLCSCFNPLGLRQIEITLLSPYDGEIINTDIPTLEWQSNSPAANYHLVVDNDSDFTSPVVNNEIITATSYVIGTGSEVLVNGTTYFWRVRGQNSFGEIGEWSSEWSFDVDTDGTPTPTPTPTPDEVPRNGLVGEWLFSGDATDTSGNGNDGTINGATFTTDRFGNSNSAPSFDGVDDRVTCSNFLNVMSFTISIWFKTDTVKTYQSLISNYRAYSFSNTGFSCMIINESNDPHLQFRVFRQPIGDIGLNYYSEDFYDNNWHHIGIVVNNDEYSLYYDNQFIDSVQYDLYNTTTEALIIGGSNSVGSDTIYSYQGELDDIRIYNRALSEYEITQLYDEGDWAGGPEVGSWSTTMSFTTERRAHTSVVHNGYLYVIGGTDNVGSFYNDVQYAPINSDGTVGTWNATTSFNTARHAHTSVIYNSYLYVIGGHDGNNYNDVQYAQINSDGTVGTWSTTTSFTNVRHGHQSVVYNGYLYVIGGKYSSTVFYNDVQYAPINSDGTIGAWSTTTPFTTTRGSHQSVVYNGYLYVMGGAQWPAGGFNDVQYVPINSDGTVGTWSTTTSFITARYCYQSIVYNGYLYVIGGNDGVGTLFNDVQFVQINNDGTVGSWSTTTPFITERWNFESVIYNRYLYVLGGAANSNNYFNDIQYAPFIP